MLMTGLRIRDEKDFFEYGGEDFKGLCGWVYVMLEGLGDIRVILVTRCFFAFYYVLLWSH